ncbi:hypothetical protein ACFX15_031653 [Malus domestica]
MENNGKGGQGGAGERGCPLGSSQRRKEENTRGRRERKEESCHLATLAARLERQKREGERGCPLGSSQRRRKERRSAGTQGSVTRGEAAIWQRELKRRTDSSGQVEGQDELDKTRESCRKGEGASEAQFTRARTQQITFFRFNLSKLLFYFCFNNV